MLFAITIIILVTKTIRELQNTIGELGVETPVVGSAMSGARTDEYGQNFWVYTPAVAIEAAAAGQDLPWTAVKSSAMFMPSARQMR